VLKPLKKSDALSILKDLWCPHTVIFWILGERERGEYFSTLKIKKISLQLQTKHNSNRWENNIQNNLTLGM
jgi:hypothetical protein